MAPDMKRLCEAMRIVFDAHYDGDATLDNDGAEALVYAVLTEMKEPQEAFCSACDARDLEVPCGYENVSVAPQANEVLAAIIDHILAGAAAA